MHFKMPSAICCNLDQSKIFFFCKRVTAMLMCGCCKSVSSYIFQVFKFPRETAMVVADSALEFASRDGLSMVISCIPVDQIYFLMLFFLYGFLSPQILFVVVPLLVFYIAFAAMVITTLQMFYKRRKLREANALAELLKQYDTAVDVDETQSQYSWNSLTPYLVFFLALPIAVMSFSLADKMYIPCSEFCVLSAVFCGICFIALSDSHDLITLLALVFNFLAALPVFFHNFPQIPVITPLIHLFSAAFVSIDLFGGIKLNIGIGSICYCLIPVFFIQMAARKSFQGMYRVLIPHLVCYFWFSMITSMYQFSTWFGLARATVGYILLPLLIPLSAFFFLIFLIYAFIKLMSSQLFGKIIVTLLLGCIPVLLTQTKKLFGGKFDKKYSSVKKIVMVVFAVLAIIPLIFVRLPSSSPKVEAHLVLPDYVRLCGPGENQDTAEEQIRCASLKGVKVAWNGIFQHTKVTSITNDIGKMLDVFPSFVSKPLRCFYGKEFGDCDTEGMSEIDRDYCQLMTSLGHNCHVKEHDKFTFNMVVTVTEGDQTFSVSAEAGDGFRETVVALEPNDEVLIKGTLLDGLGTSAPKLKLKEVTCTSRELAVMKMVVQDYEDVYYDLFQHAFEVAFNFFWHPLLEFVPESGSPAMETAAEI